jgi:hypothetical protein
LRIWIEMRRPCAAPAVGDPVAPVTSLGCSGSGMISATNRSNEEEISLKSCTDIWPRTPQLETRTSLENSPGHRSAQYGTRWHKHHACRNKDANAWNYTPRTPNVPPRTNLHIPLVDL